MTHGDENVQKIISFDTLFEENISTCLSDKLFPIAQNHLFHTQKSFISHPKIRYFTSKNQVFYT